MKNHWFQRMFCALLACILVFGYIPAGAYASETDGLCEHHSFHTEECGYSAGVTGSPCNHAHTDECYQVVTECVHVHDSCSYVAAVEGHGCGCTPDENGVIAHTEGCGYVEAVAEVPCDHVCSEESGCVKKVLNCQHQHNGECGYVEEKVESPCTFQCADCEKEAMDEETDDAADAIIDALPTEGALQEVTIEQQTEPYPSLDENQKTTLEDSAVTLTAVTSGSCGDNLVWEFDEATGTLTISGTGEYMTDYSAENPAPWSGYASSIKKIDFNSSIRKIGTYAFANCVSLPFVVLPGENSLYLGEAAFSGCSGLKEIKFTSGITHPISESAFSGVTATVYFPAGYWWDESARKSFGGDLTWVEYGEDAGKLTFYVPNIHTGETATGTVSVGPAKATADCVFTVSEPEIAEIVSGDIKSVTLRGRKAGYTTVTATDRRTGLSDSQVVCVYDGKEISFPYTEDILIDSEVVVRSYTFTPEETAKYVLITTDVSPGLDCCGFFTKCGDEYVDVLSGYWEDGMIGQVIELTAGKTYEIQASYQDAELGATATIRLQKASDEVESIDIAEDIIELELSDNSYGWASAVILPIDAYSDIQWSIKDTSIAEIYRIDGAECSIQPKKLGTTEITVTCNGKIDTAQIIVYDVQNLDLGETLELRSFGGRTYCSRTVQFTPEEDGRYVFTLTGNSLRMSYPSASGEVYYGYGEDYQTLSVELKAGEPFIVRVSGSTVTGNQAITVSKATNIIAGIKVICTYNSPTRVKFGVQFTPATAAENVVKWEVGNPKLLAQGPSDGTPFNNQAWYTPYGTGEVTVTAATESGLTASCTMVVGECLNGHDYSGYSPVVDGLGAPTGEEYRTCSRCDIVELRKIRPEQDTPSESAIVINSSDLGAQDTVWIDGAEYPVEQEGDTCKIILPDGADASIMTTFVYHEGNPSDVHTRYPTGMKVWKLKQEDGVYAAEYVPELENLLQYSGSSIRITGNKGIRMITSINQNTRNALTGNGLAGFRLLEYGTLLARTSKLGSAPLVLGGANVKSNYAYKKDVADPVFKYADGMIQYTNVLVGFADEDCKEDIAMRPYIKLQDESGEVFTIYGGIVCRSIGYIAYQNRNAFPIGSAAYEYVWDIIHYVYGTKYDADYQK